MHFFILILLNLLSNANELCKAPTVSELSLPLDPLHVVATPLEARQQFEAVYNHHRRIKNRVYWSPEKKNYIFEKSQVQFVLPSFFIDNLKNHLHQALNKGYAKHLYYADLGHLHLLIPQADWPSPLPKDSFLNSTELLSLFHTGELYQFKKGGSLSGKMTDDEEWLWIYRHRNFVGKNQIDQPITPLFSQLDAVYNTVRSLEGYKELGSVYFSAHQNGCFALDENNLDLRFDISVSL